MLVDVVCDSASFPDPPLGDAAVVSGAATERERAPLPVHDEDLARRMNRFRPCATRDDARRRVAGRSLPRDPAERAGSPVGRLRRLAQPGVEERTQVLTRHLGVVRFEVLRGRGAVVVALEPPAGTVEERPIPDPFP